MPKKSGLWTRRRSEPQGTAVMSGIGSRGKEIVERYSRKKGDA